MNTQSHIHLNLSPQRVPTRSRQNSGFTLVEIMVALTVSLILMVGIMQLFVGNKQTSRLGSGVGEVQQAGNVAIELLAENMRMAGYVGCSKKAPLTVSAMNPPFAVGPEMTGSFIPAVAGFSVAAGAWAPAVPTNWGVGAIPINNSDVLQINYGSAQNVPIAANMASSADNVVIPGNPDNAAVGDIFVIGDCGNIDIFRISSVTTAGANTSLGHNATQNNSATLSKAYTLTSNADLTFGQASGVQAIRFSSSTYFVRATNRLAADGSVIFALYRQNTSGTNGGAAPPAEELIEGVERMQVWYGQRQDINNINYLPATAVTNWPQVISVRIALLVSSRERVLDVQDNNTYALLGQNVQRAGVAGAVITYPDDRRLRRVFSTSVSLRNRD